MLRKKAMSERSLLGIALLMRQAFRGESLQAVTDELLQRVHSDSSDANALMDLSIIFQLNGEPDVAMEFQSSALAIRQLYRSRTAVGSDQLRVLAIKSRGKIMDNMPIEFLAEGTNIQLESLYVGQGIPAPTHIPEHDIAIVAICESDTNQSLLADLASILESWPRPVLNAPNRIAILSRERLGECIQGIDGLQFAPSVRILRQRLQEPGCFESLKMDLSNADEWIVRPVNSHAGDGLERVADEDGLASYLACTIADEYYIAPFVNYASVDGIYRKYRIAIVRGETFPVHMALSPRWMVHYLNADMLENSEHRAEEAAFMLDYANGFGMRHRQTLCELSTRLGLDYVVLDCAETDDGELLLFEADNGAVVHSMDSVELFPYKRPAMDRIFDAFGSMLASSACKPTGS
jgi:hypothetical protein